MPKREKILQRLRRIEGQVKGIQKMIESERVCEDVITQLIAARAALDKTIAQVIETDVETCLDGPPEESKRTFMRLIDLLLRVRSYD